MAENTILSLCFPYPTPAQAGPVDEVFTCAFQQLCDDVSQTHRCQVILTVLSNSQAKKRLSIETHQSVYNVTITGAYQNVISARGVLMRNNPLKPKLSIKISKACIATEAFPESVPGSIPEQQTTTTVSDGSQDCSKVHTTDALNEKPGSHSQSCSDSISTTSTTNSVPASFANSSAPVATTATVPTPSVTTFFSPYFMILPKFRTQVEQISSTTETAITLVSSQLHSLPSAKPVVAAHARQEMVELLVTGSWENAVIARALLLVAIDTLQSGVAHERLQVELRFQNMMGGRKRGYIQELMAKTRTSIYLASPFAQTASKNGDPVDTRFNEIHITGEPAKIQIAKDALMRAYTRVQETSPAYTRQVNIASRKLDWMLLNHRDKLRSIMLDNASYIAFPPLGGSHPTITVYGESRVNVERTIRTTMQLSSQFHSGSINMLTPVRENLLAIPLNQPNVLSPIANVSMHVAQASGAEVEFRNNGFLIFGNEIQTRMAVQYLTEVDFIKTMHYDIRFSVELANEHREFISGKKNGKINRIMKSTGAKIKFDPCNEYNFYVDLSSNIPLKAMEALALLQEELPAEISFYVPETYHKRIIGVGGKNIQRIMKKYGVYVKFSNSEEFANLGGYFDNFDNVVARTPAKNAMNLENLKHAVMELVNPKDKDFVHHSVVIPRQYHLSLLSDHAKALNEIRNATNATIRFPEKETGSDVVWISGPESFIQQATSMLLSLVDEQYVYPVPFSEAMARVLAKPEFKTEVVDKMKNEWNMTLVLPTIKEVPSSVRNENETSTEADPGSRSASSVPRRPDTTTQLSENDEKLARSLSSLTDSGDDDDDSEEDHLFVFKYSRNNEGYLQNAKELLVQYLIDSQIEVYDDEIRVRRPRSDSFAEAFPYFNSKILSSVTSGELPTPTPAFLDYHLFESAGNAFETLNKAPLSGSIGQHSGMASSGSMVASDIRAIFSQDPMPAFPPSPPRWPDQHSWLASMPGSSPSAIGSSSASGPSLSPSHTHGFYPTTPYNRLTSMPIDPWAPPGKQHPSQQQQYTAGASGYPGSVGQYRTSPPGMNSGHHSPISHSQQSQVFSPEGPYGSATGYHPAGSSMSGQPYLSNTSPVQGLSSSITNFSNTMAQQHQQDYHPSPQRPLSGSFLSHENLQFLEDKVIPGSAFGAGYGPSLNSGDIRTHQQAVYHQQAGQTYPHQSSFGLSIQYPQHRQRHSSHNSATSHHTMFLGPTDGGLGSAGGSVNSDDLSTEDETDDPLDDMRIRHRSYQFNQQGIQGGFGPQSPSYSALAHRRGSVPSMGSMHNKQPLYPGDSPYSTTTASPNVIRLSNSNSDLYGRKSLSSAMSRLSMGSPMDGNFAAAAAAGRSLGLGGHPGLVGGTNAAGPPLNILNLASASGYGNERDLFSSGLGGIIGGGTISHSQASSTGAINGHVSSNASMGLKDGHVGPTLSPSALPFS